MESEQAPEMDLRVEDSEAPPHQEQLEQHVNPQGPEHLFKTPPIKKRGPKFGSKMRSYKQSEWKALCQLYESGFPGKWKAQIEFLRSDESNPFDESNARAFSGHLKKFKKGQHSGLNVNRVREKKYKEIEDRLMNYLDLRARLYVRDRCGLSYATLREKLLKWASEMEGMEEFTASAGWISKVLKRNNKDAAIIQMGDDDVEPGSTDPSSSNVNIDDGRHENSTSCIRSFAETHTVLNEIELFIQDEVKRRNTEEFDTIATHVQHQVKALSDSIRRLSSYRGAAPNTPNQPFFFAGTFPPGTV